MNRLAAPSLILVLILCSAAFSQTPFMGMKYRIPGDANTLILINAEKMFGSPVADREGWDRRRKAAYDAGVSALPPDASEVVLAGRVDQEFGESIWELALVKLRDKRNVSSVALRYGGEMDVIAERSAARLPNDHYVVQVMDTLLASYTPANRQDVSRWLTSTDRVEPGKKLSPYLEQALSYATKVGTPIIMALDLEGVVSEAEVKRRLDSFDSLRESGVDPDQLAKLISGTQGITLGITLQKETIGAIRVDFASSAQTLAKVGKPLLIEVLQRQGAMIEDIHAWTPTVSGNTFVLKGTLSESGVRRVMSVLELPHALAESMQEASSPGADQESSAKRIASQQYYNSVTTLVEDLRVKPKRDGVQTFGQAAIWYDKYARKIDNLPILNVDETLLTYGTDIASMFREAEMAMKGVGMRSSMRTAGNSPSSGGYSSSFGGYRAGMGYGGANYGTSGVSVGVSSMNASLQAKGHSDAVIRGQERTRGAATVQNIWQTIDEATASIRREMTAKYNAEF